MDFAACGVAEKVGALGDLGGGEGQDSVRAVRLQIMAVVLAGDCFETGG